MKVAQNDETNPDTRPVRPPHTPNLSNTQLSPSGSSARKHETPGIFSRMFPPLTGTTSYHARARLASLLVLSCIDMHLFTWYSLFLPPLFSPVDYETDAAASQFDYGVDDPSLLPEQPGKPPLDHQISPILLYTACIRVV